MKRGDRHGRASRARSDTDFGGGVSSLKDCPAITGRPEAAVGNAHLPFPL
jgi:hypothetical protein